MAAVQSAKEVRDPRCLISVVVKKQKTKKTKKTPLSKLIFNQNRPDGLRLQNNTRSYRKYSVINYSFNFCF
jgi:hypothetical protein